GPPDIFGEIVIERKIEIALARAHIDYARLLRLDRMNQGCKNLHHPVDLPVLILCVIAHSAVLARDPKRVQPRLAASRDWPVLGAIMLGGNGLAAAHILTLETDFIAIAL